MWDGGWTTAAPVLHLSLRCSPLCPRPQRKHIEQTLLPAVATDTLQESGLDKPLCSKPSGHTHWRIEFRFILLQLPSLPLTQLWAFNPPWLRRGSQHPQALLPSGSVELSEPQAAPPHLLIRGLGSSPRLLPSATLKQFRLALHPMNSLLVIPVSLLSPRDCGGLSCS